MNFKAKKEQLVKEFNQNQKILMTLKQNADKLQTRQVQIQGQLLLIKELYEEKEKPLQKKNDIQHKKGKKHK